MAISQHKNHSFKDLHQNSILIKQINLLTRNSKGTLPRIPGRHPIQETILNPFLSSKYSNLNIDFNFNFSFEEPL